MDVAVEKEEQSRRRRVHDPGTSVLREPIPVVIESARIPPTSTMATEQWPSPSVVVLRRPIPGPTQDNRRDGAAR